MSIARHRLLLARPDAPPAQRARPEPTLAAISAGTALIHVVAFAQHLRESRLEAGFFAAVTVVEVLLAVLLVANPSRRLLWWTTATNAFVLAVWAASRTTGLPWTAEPWSREPVGILDLGASALEAALAVAAVRLVAERGRAPARDDRRGAAAQITAVGVVVGAALAFGGAEHGSGAVPLLAHHLLHVALIGGASLVFTVAVAARVRRDGGLSFSWRLRPPGGA